MLISVAMKSYISLYLADAPNGIFVCSAVSIGCFIALVALRSVYAFADNPKLWNEVETARGIYGVYVLRVVAVCCLICTLFLFGRFDDEMTRSFWSTMSLNKDRWNLVRIVASSLVPFCAWLMHTNPVFRIYLVVVFPCLAILDMYSELDLMAFVACIDSGLCEQASLRDKLMLWVIRDLISIAINVCGTCLSWYLWGWLGMCSNEIYFPPYEHRVLSHEVGKMSFFRQRVKRKLGDGDFVTW